MAVADLSQPAPSPAPLPAPAPRPGGFASFLIGSAEAAPLPASAAWMLPAAKVPTSPAPPVASDPLRVAPPAANPSPTPVADHAAPVRLPLWTAKPYAGAMRWPLLGPIWSTRSVTVDLGSLN
jgi:hypothetical protein